MRTGKAWAAFEHGVSALNLVGLKMWGMETDERPSPEHTTSLPGLAEFFSAVECFQAKVGKTPVNGKLHFMLLVLAMGIVLPHTEHLNSVPGWTLFTWTVDVHTTILFELFFLLHSSSPTSSYSLGNVRPSKHGDLLWQGNIPLVQGRVVEDFECIMVHSNTGAWDRVGGG